MRLTLADLSRGDLSASADLAAVRVCVPRERVAAQMLTDHSSPAVAVPHPVGVELRTLSETSRSRFLPTARSARP